MERKTFYDIQKEEYKKNVKIKKIKLHDNWIDYSLRIKIIDNNRMFKEQTITTYFLTAPTEEELERRVASKLDDYVYSRIENKCADYVAKKYNERLQEGV